jgi:hypothetical protein
MEELMRALVLAAALAVSSFTVPAVAQPSPDRAAAMAKLDWMKGTWRGPASGSNRDGSRYEVTQTERIGPMLGGDVLVMEGRGYRADGSTGFNAFGVVSWDPRSGKYELRSYAQGMAGTFELKPTADGYVWEVPAGPGAVVRYTATLHDGTWTEIGEYVREGAPAIKTFEMNLRRVGDSRWPLETPVPPKG